MSSPHADPFAFPPSSSILYILHTILSLDELVEAHVTVHHLVALCSCCSFLRNLCYKQDGNVWKLLCKRDFHWTVFSESVYSWDIYRNLFSNHGAFKLDGQTRLENRFAWSPVNRRLAATSSDSIMHVWTLPLTQPASTFGHDRNSAVVNLKWSPDSQLIVTTHVSGTLRI